MSQTTNPTLAGFNVFIRSVMQIDPLYLPVGTPVIGYAYNVALSIINPQLRVLGCQPQDQWSIYADAVYNLGGSNIVNFAQDQVGRTYFAQQRQTLGIDKFTPGVVSGTSDSGTAMSLLNPEFMKTLTLQNLQAIKDPWGRRYLSIAQAAGVLWGLN